MGKYQKKNLLLFLLAGLLAVSCTACGKETKTENSKAEISVSEQSTAVSGAEESMEEVQPVKLNHTYTTKFSDVNAVTYPHFLFDYSDNWTISQEEVTTNTESVTLANDHGAEIKFRYFGYPKDFNFGTSNATMTRVEVSKIGDSQFVLFCRNHGPGQMTMSEDRLKGNLAFGTAAIFPLPVICRKEKYPRQKSRKY